MTMQLCPAHREFPNFYRNATNRLEKTREVHAPHRPIVPVETTLSPSLQVSLLLVTLLPVPRPLRGKSSPAQTSGCCDTKEKGRCAVGITSATTPSLCYLFAAENGRGMRTIMINQFEILRIVTERGEAGAANGPATHKFRRVYRGT
jgi:hypothetical protein